MNIKTSSFGAQATAQSIGKGELSLGK